MPWRAVLRIRQARRGCVTMRLASGHIANAGHRVGPAAPLACRHQPPRRGVGGGAEPALVGLRSNPDFFLRRGDWYSRTAPANELCQLLQVSLRIDHLVWWDAESSNLQMIWRHTKNRLHTS